MKGKKLGKMGCRVTVCLVRDCFSEETETSVCACFIYLYGLRTSNRLRVQGEKNQNVLFSRVVECLVSAMTLSEVRGSWWFSKPCWLPSVEADIPHCKVLRWNSLSGQLPPQFLLRTRRMYSDFFFFNVAVMLTGGGYQSAVYGEDVFPV